MNRTENGTPGHMHNVYVNAACAGRVTCTGGKFRLVLNFTYLHALTLAAHSYTILPHTQAMWLGYGAIAVKESPTAQDTLWPLCTHMVHLYILQSIITKHLPTAQ